MPNFLKSALDVQNEFDSARNRVFDTFECRIFEFKPRLARMLNFRIQASGGLYVQFLTFYLFSILKDCMQIVGGMALGAAPGGVPSTLLSTHLNAWPRCFSGAFLK